MKAPVFLLVPDRPRMRKLMRELGSQIVNSTALASAGTA